MRSPRPLIRTAILLFATAVVVLFVARSVTQERTGLEDQTYTPSPTPFFTDPSPTPEAEPEGVSRQPPEFGEGKYVRFEIRFESSQVEAEAGLYSQSDTGERVREHTMVFLDGMIRAVDGEHPSTGRRNIQDAPVIGRFEKGENLQGLIHLSSNQLAGANYYLSGGQYGLPDESWSLVWRSPYEPDAETTPGTVQADSTAGTVTITDSGVIPSQQPAVLDQFGPDVGPLTHLNGREPDWPVSSQTWETPGGSVSWLVVEGVTTSRESRTIAVIETNTPDGLISTTLSPWSISGVVLRYVDPNNWIGIRRRASDNNLVVVRLNGGDAERIVAASLNGPPRLNSRLDVYMIGDLIRVHVDQREVLTVKTDFNANATRHGLWSFGNSTRYHDFAVWPASPELNSQE